MKKYYFLLFLIPLFNYSQTPCSGGFAGSYSCSNYDLQDHFNKATLSNQTGADIWGWTDPLDNTEYAITTFRDKTCFLDISDPVNPVYKGFLNTRTVNSLWRDVKVYKNHAFIVSEAASHGVQIFDLTRLRNLSGSPKNFNADAVLRSGGLGLTIGNCHNIVINEEKPMAYLVGCGANGGGPIMVDISNPTSPVIVGQYKGDGYTHDAQVVTYRGPDKEHAGKEIYIGSNGGKIAIVDVTNPAQPKKISQRTYANTAYTHQGWFDESHKYFFLGDEIDEERYGNKTRTIIFDFTDLDNPKYHSQYIGPKTSTDHNLYIKGNLMYISNYTAGLRTYDISDVNNIKEAGFFDTYPSDNSIGYKGVWSVYPYFKSGNIIISDMQRGFFVVKGTGAALSVKDDVLNKSDFSVHPNPASEKLMISSKTEIIKSIALFNVLGEKILEVKGGSIEYKLDISSLPEAFYFVKINNLLTKKILVKR